MRSYWLERHQSDIIIRQYFDRLKAFQISVWLNKFVSTLSYWPIILFSQNVYQPRILLRSLPARAVRERMPSQLSAQHSQSS